MTVLPLVPLRAGVGLDTKAATQIAGMPVLRLSLTEIHWEHVFFGRTLTPKELHDRTETYWLKIKDAGFDTVGFTRETAQSIALMQYPECIPITRPVTLSAAVVAKHYALPASMRWETPIDYAYVPSNAATSVLVKRPLGTLPDLPQQAFSKPQPWFKASAAIILTCNFQAKEFWSRMAEIPSDKLTRFPESNGHILFFDRHEVEHGRQISLRNPIVDFYSELGCDRAAHRQIDQDKQDPEIHKAVGHVRFLRMLKDSPKYWFQPIIEESYFGPTTYPQILASVMEIRCRLGMHGLGIEQNSHPSTTLQSAALAYAGFGGVGVGNGGLSSGDNPSHKLIARLHQKHTETNRMVTMLPTLRKLVDAGVFRTNPLTEKIATRILAAGEYFSEGVTYASALKLHLEKAPSRTIGAESFRSTGYAQARS